MTDTLSPLFLYKLSILMDTGLLDHNAYYPWSDALIDKLPQPPLWLLELSVEKNPGKAAALLKKEAVLPFQEQVQDFNFKDFFAASYFVATQQGTLSWQDFLMQAGICADGPEATVPVYDFYEALQTYVNSGLSEESKAQQVQWVSSTLKDSISDVEKTLAVFST